jgi:hypothetical protein
MEGAVQLWLHDPQRYPYPSYCFLFFRAYSLARLTSLNKELFSNDFDQIAIVKVLHKVTKFEHHTNQSR